MKHSLASISALLLLLTSPLAHAQQLLGNGGIAFSFQQKGQLESLLWPGSGGAEQLHRSGAAFFANPVESALHGAQWGIGAGEKIDWQEHNINGVAWDAGHIPAVSRSTTSHESVYSQSALALSSANVLALQLSVLSGDTHMPFYWFQDFNPSLTQATGWSGASDISPYARDFAAFFDSDSKTLYQFRPNNPSGGDRENARSNTINQGQTQTKAWDEFADGVWIGTTSAEPITAYHCVNMPIDKSVLDAPFRQTESSCAYGDAAAFLQIEPHRSQTILRATLFIAIGESKAKVDESLYAVRGQSFDALVQHEKAAWDARLSTLIPEDKVEVAELRELEEAIAFLFNSRDSASGAIVHAPLPGGPAYAANASVWPGDVAWIVEALLTLKMPETAEKHLDFCLRGVNAQSSPERPAGSLPFAIYTDGRPAALPFIPDTEASAKTLIALWRFARGTTAEGGYPTPDYLSRTRASVDLLAQFLAMQFNNADEKLAASFQPQQLRDAHSESTLLMAYLGLVAAREILAMQAADFPTEWARSVKACESQIRFAILNETTPWPISSDVIYWMELLLPLDHPLWKVPVTSDESVKTLGQLRASQQGFLEGAKISNSLQAPKTIIEFLGK